MPFAEEARDLMKHVLTLEEIATACSEYVIKKYYPGPTLWHAKASVETVAVPWKSNFPEGVITCISIEIQPPTP
jgi:hypothetical protein